MTEAEHDKASGDKEKALAKAGHIEAAFLRELMEICDVLVDGDHHPLSCDYKTQVLVAGYRIDVVLYLPNDGDDLRLAVELDGHEWHERTRQQASSDRARDRHLLREGVPTIRFTGSDVHRDPRECAMEAVQTLFAMREKFFSLAFQMARRDEGGIERQLSRFRENSIAKDERHTDWNALWRRWLRNAHPGLTRDRQRAGAGAE